MSASGNSSAIVVSAVVVAVVDGAVVGVATRAEDGTVVATDLDGKVLTSLSAAQVVEQEKTIVAVLD